MKVRVTYLTIRCLWGCEAWLSYRASVLAHHGRCRGRPWVDDIDDVAVIPDPYTKVITDAVDGDLVGGISLPGESRTASGGGNARYPAPTPKGTRTIQSPLEGIRARRWLTVAIAAFDAHGHAGLERALDADRFHALEADVLTPGAFTECPYCGALINSRALKQHQATNGVCGFRRGVAEIEAAWRRGWRDPYSVPDAPLRWVDLQATRHWRRRIHTVRFPRWIAVLLAPHEGRPSPSDLVTATCEDRSAPAARRAHRFPRRPFPSAANRSARPTADPEPLRCHR